MNSFDLVVGNVPFSSTRIYDRLAPTSFSLHNYFLWRALCACRPGGLVIMVTSRYTLDAQRCEQREVLAHNASLLGAIRLPSGAHKEASTEVVTDILVLQRKSPEIAWGGHDWTETIGDVIEGIEVNEYFKARPTSILGTAEVSRGMYRDNDLVIRAPEDMAADLDRVISRIVEEARYRGAIYIPPKDHSAIPDILVKTRTDGKKEGSYHIIDGTLVQITDGEGEPVKKLVEELISLVRLRDGAMELLNAERDLDKPDDDLTLLRRELNDAYDAYKSRFGAIHRAKVIIGEPDPETGEQTITRRRPPALYAFSRDPDYFLVLGLESYDDATQEAEKAPIFSRRVHVRPVRKTHAETPAEALALCLDERGSLDIYTIGQLLGTSAMLVPDLLGDLVYHDPKLVAWVTTSEYLSGNVREKLEQARAAAESNPNRYSRNVAALEPLIPEDLVPEEIKAMLGAPWIEASDIAQFCQDTFEYRTDITYERLLGTWTVNSSSWQANNSLLSTSEWGTDRMNAYRLVEVGLNKGIPVVYDTLPDDTRIKNVEASLAAQDKLRVIQARFSDWVWEDSTRATRLAAVYNRIFNSTVPRSYDGSHLTFPGMSEEWQDKLYPWQKDFVWRMVQSKGALCGHPVGAGKTTTEIAGAMTLRRLGLITRAAIVVPNHLLEQIAAEAARLFPAANILMVSRDDLTRERRKLFAARVTLGDYDLIVMTHAGLGAIGVHPDTEKAYIDKRIAAYREALLAAGEEDQSSKRSIKKLETAIEKMRQRQAQLLDMPHDDGITFEQLGISYLIYDEAHALKNLGLPTNIQGLAVKPSKRATDTEMKLRWLEEHNEGRPFASFFTATPISNSMVEAYVIAWYLDQQLLWSYELRGVDPFASVFIEFQTRVEVSPNGASFRLHTRPSRFVNMPEFLTLFTMFADLRSPEILAGSRPEAVMHTVTIEPTEEVTAYVNALVERSDALHQGQHRLIGGVEDNMLLVTTHGRLAALDLSLVGIEPSSSPKLEAVAANILEVYRRWQEEASFLDGEFKSLQIVFCDLGTPNDESDQVYGKLKRLLVEGGIPAHGIRYIHETKGSDSAKARLFTQCRSGQVAVLLGSTQMLGTGTNIQDRAAALHHVDAPWRPDEVEQREGRALRPGNLYPKVEIFRNVTRRTFDAYSWQTLANKAVYYDQLRSGRIKGREMEALGDTALSYGQVKAAATGDPLVLEQADLSVTVAHLERLRSAHLRARRRDAQEAALARGRAADANHYASRLLEVGRAIEASTASFTTTRGVAITEKSEVATFIAERLTASLNRGGGQEWLGRLGELELHTRVSKVMRNYLVELVLGKSLRESISIHVEPTWLLSKSQYWRITRAIESRIANAESDAEYQKGEAESELEKANSFEAHSRESFPQEAELVKRVLRKRDLDEYTKLCASAQGDTEKQQEATTMRARLMEDVIVDSSDIQVVVPTRIAPPRRPGSHAEEKEARKLKFVLESKSTLVFGEMVDIFRAKAKKEKTRKAPVPEAPSLFEAEPIVAVTQNSLWG